MKYMITFESDGPVRNLNLTVPPPEGEVPPDSDLGRLIAWEKAKKPALMAMIEMGSIRHLLAAGMSSSSEIAHQFIVGFPWVDAWVLHHFNKTWVEGLVRELRRAGKIVIRPVDMLAQPLGQSGEVEGNWQRVRSDLLKRYDVALRDKDDYPLNYRWLRNGVMIDWSKMTKEPMEYLLSAQGFFEQPEQMHNVFMFDQAWKEVHSWMLLEGRESVELDGYELPAGRSMVTIADLADLYDARAYVKNLTTFMRDLLEQTESTAFLNGDSRWAGSDWNVMEEAANVRGLDQFERILEVWGRSYGNVIELRSPGRTSSPQQTMRAFEALSQWKKDGGLIWPDNPWHPFSSAHPNGEMTKLQRIAVGLRGDTNRG